VRPSDPDTRRKADAVKQVCDIDARWCDRPNPTREGDTRGWVVVINLRGRPLDPPPQPAAPYTPGDTPVAFWSPDNLGWAFDRAIAHAWERWVPHTPKK